jgi:hypothetical protein
MRSNARTSKTANSTRAVQEQAKTERRRRQRLRMRIRIEAYLSQANRHQDGRQALTESATNERSGEFDHDRYIVRGTDSCLEMDL